MIMWIWLIWWVVSFFEPIVIWVPESFPLYGLTIAPFIFLNEQTHEKLWVLLHERRHLIQQRVLSPLIFMMVYFTLSAVLFVYALIVYRDFSKAFDYAWWFNWLEEDARCRGGYYTDRCRFEDWEG